jgi:hypothetical protein
MTQQNGRDHGPAHRLTVGVPERMYDELSRFAQGQGLSVDDALLHLLSVGLFRSHEEASGTPVSRVTPSLSAWRAHPPVDAERPLERYEWAEQLATHLPFRFQKYVAQLLFDDERVLYFCQRPPFTRATHRFRRPRKVNEGLLVITDRMVLMIEDAIPPGSMFVDWGYNARLTAVERVAAARVEEGSNAVLLCLTCEATGGQEDLRLEFHAGQASDLLEATALLNRYGDRRTTLPARTYSDPSPQWETPGERAARLRIAGRDERPRDEGDRSVARTESGETRLAFDGVLLTLSDRGRTQEAPVGAISSVGVWRAVMGCSLDIHVPQGGRDEAMSITFEYPESAPYLRIASQLRHAMGRHADCAVPSAQP